MAGQVVEVYNNPAGVTGVIIELWAAGASGGRGFAGGGNSGNGGGGGMYVRSSVPAVPSTAYTVRWGLHGISMTGPGESGGNSDSGSLSGVPVAVGGIPVTGGFAGAGDVTRDGGNGGPGSAATEPGYSGGACGSRDGDGGDASPAAGGAPGTAVSPDGGDGGQGGALDSPGAPGTEPGGGGGGGGTDSMGFNRLGGDGGDGVIVIWEDLGAWPPTGQIPLAGFGTGYIADPDRFTAIAGLNPKARPNAFVL